jgi:FKBP-type peptidyl-prolyl cis-trans isomerase FklB
MKVVWCACISLVLMACQGNTQEKVQIKSSVDSVSYAIGIDIGRNLKKQSIDVTPAVLAQGIHDAADSGKALLTDEQCAAVMMSFQHNLVAKELEKNKKAGEAFLAANKAKPGVITTASGLQYKIITPGKGPKPDSTQTVTLNYRGTLVDGTEFDNTYKRGQPLTYAVKGFCRGFSEALMLMPIGSKWEITVPYTIAYGEAGAGGGTIPPGATLFFEVELLAIK